jgi:hypothetical protein
MGDHNIVHSFRMPYGHPAEASAGCAVENPVIHLAVEDYWIAISRPDAKGYRPGPYHSLDGRSRIRV